MRKLLFVALLAGLLAYALSPQWRSFEAMGDARFRALHQLPKEILVGVSWPFAINEDGMADGLLLAQEEINSKGLARGVPVRLILRDDNFDWEESKRIAIDFAGNPRMSAVLGYYDDSEGIKASAMFEASRMLHLMVAVNNTAMTSHGEQYLVRTILSNDKIGRTLAHLSKVMGHRKVAVIWEEGGYGEDLAYQYRVAMDALDLQLVYQWSYVRERADFRMPVNELKGLDADVIFFAGLEPWAGDFIRMARGVGIKTEIVGAFSDTPLMRARAGAALEGAMYFDYYNVNSLTPENQDFVRKFRARFHRNPDTSAAQGYDALRIIANAVQVTGSANPLDLSYAIRFMDPWEGANGRYKFDSHGELEDKPIYFNVYRNGVPVMIPREIPVTPDIPTPPLPTPPLITPPSLAPPVLEPPRP